MTELNAATFDFYAVATGATAPEDEVPVYTDGKTAYDLHKLEKKLDSTFGYRKGGETEEEFRTRVQAVEDEIAELKEKMRGNRVVFSLKGLLPEEMKKLAKQLDAEFGEGTSSSERNERWSAMLLAAHIVKITDVSGAVDNSTWDADKVAQLFTILPQESSLALLDKVADLTGETTYFHNVEIDSDF